MQNTNKRLSKLRGRIVERYGTNESFRKVLGISKTTMSKKMTGRTSFSQDDMVEWSKLLGIDIKNVGEYFFA